MMNSPNNIFSRSDIHDDIWTFSALLALYEGVHRSPVESPAQRQVSRSLDIYFDLHLKKSLSKQSRRRWFETPSQPLWRHCNG